MNKDLNQILDQASAASIAASQAIWDRDEHQDRGSCGGCVMILDKRTKLAKLAIERGIASKRDEVFCHAPQADGIHSQNADISQAAGRAFRDVLIDNGLEKAIRKFWTYVD